MSDNPRDYKCKDEELPVIGGFVLSSMKKDLAVFTAYSPKFDAAFVSEFEALNASVSELVTPAEETAQLKAITRRLNANMQKLIQALDWLSNYVEMAETSIPVSVTDFGISGLRRAIHRGDAENALKNLRVVIRSIARYADPLAAQGFTAEQQAVFSESVNLIDTDNTTQHDILSGRQKMVNDNVELLNQLNVVIKRVCKTGKALFKKTEPSKVSDYTFTSLMKEVRHQAKKDKEAEVPGLEVPTDEATA